MPGLTEQENLTAWPDLDTIPEQVSATGTGGLEVRGYPALVADWQQAVHVRVLTDATSRDLAHPRGVAELLARTQPLAPGRITSRWSGTMALTLGSSPYRSTEALVADLVRAAVGRLTSTDELRAVRTEAAFRALAARVHGALEDEVFRLAALVAQVLDESRELDRVVTATTSLALLDVLTDVREQHAALVYDGFIAATAPDRLEHLPRYLQAAQMRLQKAADNPHRDADLAWQLNELRDAWWATQRSLAGAAVPGAGGAGGANGAGGTAPTRAADPTRGPDGLPLDPTGNLTEVRWMLEELRVSFFAQQLGTAGTVSAKRIRKALAQVRG